MSFSRGSRVTQALVAAALAASGAHGVSAQPGGYALEILSSRPDTVSGGDALVELRPPPGSRWKAMLDGREVTASFRRSESGDWVALLTGLTAGENSLEIQEAGASRAKFVVIDHPISGPIFSGPQRQPFLCQTVANGLGPPTDSQCSAQTVIQYYYKSTRPTRVSQLEGWEKALEVIGGKPGGLPPGFRVYDPQAPASDIATTVTSDGRTVPYVVRREMGVINRSIYDIRFLHEPGQPLPSPWSRNHSNWNGRLVYELGGGCAATYRQGTLYSPASHEAILAQGYAVATSTLNISANSCDDVLSAETLSMVKEHFVKEFGVPTHTIGWGDSAGALQQYLIAQNYPGLLDGIIPYVSFPDVVSYLPSSSDCSLLLHAFDKAKRPWAEEQKSAATGFATWQTCAGLVGYAISPRNCDAAIPPTEVYDRTNPKGVRCDIYDYKVNVFGRDPQTGFAARPLDNVGVQYGLVPFNEGKIDAEQFIELNEFAGGFDEDGNVVAQRTQASPEIIQRAYRSGVILTGGGGLAETPIIDWRWYSDEQGDNHDSVRSLVTRARLIAANGTAANQVILTYPQANSSVMAMVRISDPDPQSSSIARHERDLVREMDRWLDNVAADTTPGPRSAKVARAKPPELVDGCWTTGGVHVVETDTEEGLARCRQIYPPHGDPRIAAGGPLADDVLKCSLKPVRAADYAQPLSVEQLGRLREVFPAGVCDYTRPGVAQEVTKATWQSYSSPTDAREYSVSNRNGRSDLEPSHNESARYASQR